MMYIFKGYLKIIKSKDIHRWVLYYICLDRFYGIGAGKGAIIPDWQIGIMAGLPKS
jgi:hypothetical protein